MKPAYVKNMLTIINISADIEFVKKLTQARFLKTKLYPKVRKSQ